MPIDYEQKIQALLEFMMGAALAAGSTTYMGLGAHNATEANIARPVAIPGTIRNMYNQCRVAPGAGETFTYT